MEIAGLTDLSAVTEAAGVKTLGKEDFLNLLLKQLSFQDPLNPMDSTQFTSQLTQFSSLEELSNINDTLADVLAFQHSMQNASVADLIGKNVEAPGNSINLDETASISYELPADASQVLFSVYDSTGKLIWSEDAGPQPQGLNRHVWHGKDFLGVQQPSGSYSYDIEAKGTEGEFIEAGTNMSGLVTGVEFQQNLTYLVIDGKTRIHLNDIQAIGQ